MGSNQATQARNAEMFELRARGWSQRDLAERYDIGVAAVSAALKSYAKTHIKPETKDELREIIKDIYFENIRSLYEIAKAGPIPAYSNGRPIVVVEAEDADDGTPVYADDHSGVIRARAEIRAYSESLRKMLGLDDATKIETSGGISITLIGKTDDGLDLLDGV